MLELPVRPGLVSVFYFFILDLILLTVLDSSLSRLISGAYHRRIQHSKSIRLSSCDIPGITNFQLDSFYLIPNLTALFVKLVFLSTVIALEWNIKSKFRTDYTERRLHGTYAYNASHAAINNESVKLRKAQRLWLTQRMCRRVDDGEKGKITFYHLAYNFEGGITLASEILNKSDSYVPIDDKSVVCMAPDKVTRPWELMIVSGCSRRENKACTSDTPITASLGDFNMDDKSKQKEYWFSHFQQYKLIMRLFSQDEVLSILPAYRAENIASVDMLCMIAEYWVNRVGETENKTRTTCLTTKILTSNETVIEWWRYDEKRNEITSPYAGPVFEGALDIGLLAKATYVFNLQRSAPSYIDLSSIVVAETQVFQAADIDVVVIENRRVITVLPMQAVALFFAFVFGVLVTGVSAVLFASHKKLIIVKPRKTAPKSGKGDKVQLLRKKVVYLQQINTINGLSNIVHKEIFGDADAKATSRHQANVNVGLSINKKGELHFGPLFKEAEAVRLVNGANIV